VAAPPLRAVLFDFAGTTFDDRGILTVAGVQRHAAARGIEIADADAAAAIERTMVYIHQPEHDEAKIGSDLSQEAHRHTWQGLIAEAGPWPDALAEAIYEALVDNEAWLPYPDTLEVLGALSAHGVPVGLVSNIGWDIRPALERAGALAHLQTVLLSWEEGLVKPDPAFFALACERLGSQPGETLFVGDNPETDGGAVQVGLSALLLPSERPTGRPRGLARVLPLVGAAP
jgi:HAD superfamily hydrolase (TIGR01509 family)